MDKRIPRLICAIGIAGIFPILSGGCSVNRTPRGWIVRSGCTLEYARPFRCSLHGPASETCLTTDSQEHCADHEASGEALSADSVEKIIGNGENSGVLRLLQRRGRLGICAKCKKLVHVGAAGPPPTAGTEPVHARFFPVPTQPVFTAREFPLAAKNVQAIPGDPQAPGPPLPASPSSPLTMPEEIPTPPAAAKPAKETGPIFALKKMGQSSIPPAEASEKESSWVFSKPPERKPDPVVEIPPPSAYGSYGAPRGTHASQPSTRR